jgi:SAM-dependent MidA family methyltransferase
MVDEIRARGGSVPFDVFMELALYHPRHGYYSTEKRRYGREGDYLTAPTASEWYTRVVARLLGKLADEQGRHRLVDVASGDGSFVAGVLEALTGGADRVLEEIVSVERSRAMQDLQRQRLGEASTAVRWCDRLDRIGESEFPTVVHASELYDAQPVVRVVGSDEGLRELWVGIAGSDLKWLERPPREEVVEYFSGHGVEIVQGQIAEANLDARGAHRDLLAAVGEEGLALVLDYGYEPHRLYNPRGRRSGSLATFRRHEVGRDPLESPGEVDLTAHVNWRDLRKAAATEGWFEIGLMPLAEFLVRAGLAEELEERGFGAEADLDAATFTVRQEIKRLLDPEGMGSDLKMLVQAKGKMVDLTKRVLSVEL